MSEEKLIVGQINGVFGVQGWVKIFSHTDPRKNILDYSPWWINCKGEWKLINVVDSKVQQGGKTLVAKLENVDDRDVAREYMGCEIAIERSQLVKSQDDYYWIDLIGCQVITEDGVVLGEVKDLIETGAHDVLRVQGEHSDLIPFVMEEFIIEVDIANKRIVVDWEPDSAEEAESAAESDQ
jgi:16S rRNA processing protein RimM